MNELEPKLRDQLVDFTSERFTADAPNISEFLFGPEVARSLTQSAPLPRAIEAMGRAVQLQGPRASSGPLRNLAIYLRRSGFDALAGMLDEAVDAALETDRVNTVQPLVRYRKTQAALIALVDHFNELFADVASLRRFVGLSVQGGQKVNGAVSSNGSSREHAFQMADQLYRYGLVDAHLFEALRREFPGRSDDIGQIESLHERA